MNFRAWGFERRFGVEIVVLYILASNSFDLNRELLTSNIRDESFWRWIEEELTRKWNYCGFPLWLLTSNVREESFWRWIEEEIRMKIKLSRVSLYEFSRPRFGGRDLGWKSWFCTYWLKTLLIWEENCLPPTSGRKVSGGGSKRN